MRLVETGNLPQYIDFQLPATIPSKVGDYIDPVDFLVRPAAVCMR